MANMSYCRFHNTSQDLIDCLNALRNDLPLSDSEERKAKQLIKTCMEIIETVGGSVELYDKSVADFLRGEENSDEDE